MRSSKYGYFSITKCFKLDVASDTGTQTMMMQRKENRTPMRSSKYGYFNITKCFKLDVASDTENQTMMLQRKGNSLF